MHGGRRPHGAAHGRRGGQSPDPRRLDRGARATRRGAGAAAALGAHDVGGVHGADWQAGHAGTRVSRVVLARRAAAAAAVRTASRPGGPRHLHALRLGRCGLHGAAHSPAGGPRAVLDYGAELWCRLRVPARGDVRALPCLQGRGRIRSPVHRRARGRSGVRPARCHGDPRHLCHDGLHGVRRRVAGGPALPGGHRLRRRFGDRPAHRVRAWSRCVLHRRRLPGRKSVRTGAVRLHDPAHGRPGAGTGDRGRRESPRPGASGGVRGGHSERHDRRLRAGGADSGDGPRRRRGCHRSGADRAGSAERTDGADRSGDGERARARAGRSAGRGCGIPFPGSAGGGRRGGVPRARATARRSGHAGHQPQRPGVRDDPARVPPGRDRADFGRGAHNGRRRPGDQRAEPRPVGRPALLPDPRGGARAAPDAEPHLRERGPCGPGRRRVDENQAVGGRPLRGLREQRLQPGARRQQPGRAKRLRPRPTHPHDHADHAARPGISHGAGRHVRRRERRRHFRRRGPLPSRPVLGKSHLLHHASLRSVSVERRTARRLHQRRHQRESRHLRPRHPIRRDRAPHGQPLGGVRARQHPCHLVRWPVRGLRRAGRRRRFSQRSRPRPADRDDRSDQRRPRRDGGERRVGLRKTPQHLGGRSGGRILQPRVEPRQRRPQDVFPPSPRSRSPARANGGREPVPGRPGILCYGGVGRVRRWPFCGVSGPLLLRPRGPEAVRGVLCLRPSGPHSDPYQPCPDRRGKPCTQSVGRWRLARIRQPGQRARSDGPQQPKRRLRPGPDQPRHRAGQRRRAGRAAQSRLGPPHPVSGRAARGLRQRCREPRPGRHERRVRRVPHGPRVGSHRARERSRRWNAVARRRAPSRPVQARAGRSLPRRSLRGLSQRCARSDRRLVGYFALPS